MDDLPIRVPSEEGKRRQVDRPKEPVPFGVSSEDVSPHGWVDPRSHPFALLIFPGEHHRSSWVKPWRFGYHWVPFPEGSGSFLAAGPPRVRFAWRYLSSLMPRQWGTSTPLKPPFEGLSTRPFLKRSRRMVSGQVLGMRAKARSFDA